jgi:peroxiredoxin Q/BCP
MFGKKYYGVIRSTFVIDTDGKVASVFKKVKAKENNERVLDALNEIGIA